MEKNKNEKLILGYILIIICAVVNFFIILPVSTFFCFVGVVMSGGFTSFLFVLLIIFCSGMLLYLLGLLVFLFISKKIFYKNLIIVMVIHFIISIFYSYMFVIQF